MSFEQYKNNAMKDYIEHKRIGRIDKDIQKELDEFNKLEDFYTTSSCSGRILLVNTPEGVTKTPDAFYYVTHEKSSPDVIINKIKEYDKELELWFKMESFILHIGCSNIENARKLLMLCKKSGIKRAGINSWSKRIIIEITGTMNMETIIIKNNKVFVNDDYLRLLVSKANTKLGSTKKRIHSFFRETQKNL